MIVMVKWFGSKPLKMDVQRLASLVVFSTKSSKHADAHLSSHPTTAACILKILLLNTKIYLSLLITGLPVFVISCMVHQKSEVIFKKLKIHSPPPLFYVCRQRRNYLIAHYAKMRGKQQIIIFTERERANVWIYFQREERWASLIDSRYSPANSFRSLFFSKKIKNKK